MSPGALADVIARTAGDDRSPVMALVGNWRRLAWLEELGPVLASGRSVLVVAASAAEVTDIAERAGAIWGGVAVAVSGEDDKTDTKTWQAAQSPPRLVIGTPKTASWRIGGLGLAIVLEEGRRAMKDRQTPTLHVRDLMRTRSRLEGFNLVFYGPTPSVELLVAGAETVHEGNRAWPLVEIVDRTEDRPGSGFLSDRSLAAISATAESGERVFVFTRGSARRLSARRRSSGTFAAAP
jgi:primosomal protein N'